MRDDIENEVAIRRLSVGGISLRGAGSAMVGLGHAIFESLMYKPGREA
jgi:hypothetical protein